MMPYMTLDEYLTKNDITEAQFAALVGVNQSTIHRLRKRAVPSRDLMVRIYEATRHCVRADDFYGIRKGKPNA